MSIVIDEVHKRTRLIRHMLFNDLADGRPGPLQQDVRTGGVHLGAESSTQLTHSRGSCATGRDEREQVRAQPFGLAGVAAHELDERAVHLAGFEELHGGDLEAIVKDGLCVDGHTSGDLTLDVSHVAEVGCPADEFMFVENGEQDDDLLGSEVS